LAASGPALIHDRESIPLIVEACRKAPADEAALIGRALMYFDDTDAQRAVDVYVPKPMAEAYRDGRADGHGPFD
jgi:hypothetical protein